MVRLTVIDRCKNVAERWYKQYKRDIDQPKNGRVFVTLTGYKVRPKIDVYNDLLQLNGKGTPQQITEIIGNKSWVTLMCDVCRNDVNEVIWFDTECYECRGVQVCLPCLQEAQKLILAS